MARDQRSEAELRNSDSHAGWDFATRDQRQSWERAQRLTPYMGFHGKRSEIKNRAEKKHRDSQAGSDFMARDQRSETELRSSTVTHMLDQNFMAEDQRSETELKSSTVTHMLDGISWQKIRDQLRSSTVTHTLDGISRSEISWVVAQWLTHWMGFHCKRSEIKNRVEKHSNSHPGQNLGQLENFHLTCLLPAMAHIQNFQNFPSITFNFSPFLPYHSHNEHTVKWAWCYTHILIIQVKLCRWLDHGAYILKYLSSPISLAQVQVTSHMILLNFSHGSRKGIWLTYLEIGMSKPRGGPHDQFLLYSFECSCLYIKAKMYHCWSICEDIPAIERSVEAKIETMDKWSTDLFTAYSMHTSRLFCWTVTNNIFSAKSSIDAAVCLISSPTWSW